MPILGDNIIPSQVIFTKVLLLGAIPACIAGQNWGIPRVGLPDYLIGVGIIMIVIFLVSILGSPFLWETTIWKKPVIVFRSGRLQVLQNTRSPGIM